MAGQSCSSSPRILLLIEYYTAPDSLSLAFAQMMGNRVLGAQYSRESRNRVGHKLSPLLRLCLLLLSLSLQYIAGKGRSPMDMFYDKILVGGCNVILPNVLKPYSHSSQKGDFNHFFFLFSSISHIISSPLSMLINL